MDRQYSQSFLRQDGQAILTQFLAYPTMFGIPPIEMVGKRCNAKCEILVESIFVGATVTIQVKLDRACICAPKRRAIQRRPMHVYVAPDDEIHEVAGQGAGCEMAAISMEDDIDIPGGSDDEKSGKSE